MPLMDNTRRGFMGLLLSTPVAVAMAAKAEFAEWTPSKSPNGHTIYRGYDIHWTGWKMAQGNLTLAAQWVGWPIVNSTLDDTNRPCLVACVPGEEAPFARGGEFNIWPREGQKHITYRDSEATKESIKHKELKRLLRMIDAVMDNPTVRNLRTEEWAEFLRSKGAIRCL